MVYDVAMKDRMAVPILVAFLISTFAGPLCCCGIAFSPLTVVGQSQGKAEQQSCCSPRSTTDRKSATAFSVAHQNCHCHAAYQSTAEAATKSLVSVPHTDEAPVWFDTRESYFSAAIEVLKLHSGRAGPAGTSRSIHVLHSQFLI